MRNSVALSLVLLGLLNFALLTSARGVSYIYAPEHSAPSNLLKEKADSTVYSDAELKHLILHNLNLLNENEEVSTSGKRLIQEYGNKNLMKSQKLNYAFLLEGKPTSGVEKGRKTAHKHRVASFDICNDESSCVLNHLYDTNNDNSVFRNLKTQSRRDHPEAYFYSSNPAVGSRFGRAHLRTASDKLENIYVVDQGSNNKFKIADNLHTCINNILKGEYEVDLQTGTVKSLGNIILSTSTENRQALIHYLHDICSVVGVSSLIRKDANPSFFTFHISSLNNLQKTLPEDNHAHLNQIFNIAYEKFLQNLLAHYGSDEVSGQVIVLAPETIKAGEQEVALIELPTTHFVQTRNLQATTTTTTTTTSASGTKIIFGGTLIVFVIVTAWVCIELFNMDIQKDSVVYAKFLAADYFKR